MNIVLILRLQEKKTPRSVISDFNIDRQYEDRDKDEQPDTTDMP